MLFTVSSITLEVIKVAPDIFSALPLLLSQLSWPKYPRVLLPFILWKHSVAPPLLKATHKISHAPGPRAKEVIWKKPGSDPPADLREPPHEAGETGAHPGNTNTGGSHSWELVLPHGHLCWQVPFWNPPWRLLVPDPSPTHQPVSTSAEMSQAKQKAG